MIPINEAIESGAWLHCSFGDQKWKEEFRLRILSFKTVNLSELEDPGEGVTHDGDYWIIRFEVVSLNKKTISSARLRDSLRVVDQEGFQFKYPVRFLGDYNGYAARTGLRRMDYEDLLPKIKTVGAIVYLLPKAEESEYSLAVEDGAIREA